MDLKLPSRFQPCQVVLFKIGNASLEAYVENVRFTDDGSILYGLQVYHEGGDDLHVYLGDVPSAFVEVRLTDNQKEDIFSTIGEIVKPQQ